jgi:ATP synthase F0 subunit b
MLEIAGESCEQPTTFSLKELKEKFQPQTLQMVLECAGNGRSEFNPPATGNQWTTGGVGCPQWTGVRLADVLRHCGVKKNAVYVGYYGADVHLSGDPKKSAISRGVPITKALDERSKRIADGLAAADKAKTSLAAAEQRVEAEIKAARASAAEVRSSGEKQAAQLLEEARAESARIVADARKAAEAEAALAAQRAKDQLREQVATRAVAGAERILRREIDANRHAELLSGLKAELR